MKRAAPRRKKQKKDPSVIEAKPGQAPKELFEERKELLVEMVSFFFS